MYLRSSRIGSTGALSGKRIYVKFVLQTKHVFIVRCIVCCAHIVVGEQQGVFLE